MTFLLCIISKSGIFQLFHIFWNNTGSLLENISAGLVFHKNVNLSTTKAKKVRGKSLGMINRDGLGMQGLDLDLCAVKCETSVGR